jgi:glutaredoxin
MPEPIRPLHIEIYSRPGCHLCEDARESIDRVLRGREADVRVINVEDDPELEAAYGMEIPVVMIDGEKAFIYRVDEAELERKITALWNR